MPAKPAHDARQSPVPRHVPDPCDEVLAGTGMRHFTPDALRLFLACSRQITLGLAHALSKLWRREDPVRAGFAELKLVQVELAKQRAVSEIIRKRLARFPARQRKHYTPEQRFEILVLARTYGLSRAETARTFLVDPQTISRWEREAMAEPGRTTVGTLVRASPPLRGFDDVVKRLVQMLDSLDVGGSTRIAQMLARAGTRIGRETARRYRRAQRLPQPRPEPKVVGPVLRAKYVNHVWLADLTEIRGFLGLLVFKVVVVLDLLSRFPLAFGVFLSEPSSEDVLQVLDRAMKAHGRPRHFVSDQGAQLTAEVFRETLDALGIRQRFGAVGQYGSIAIVERFWRTLKELLGVRIWPPLSKEHLEHRLELTLAYYAALRPHQGLGGATPAEVYLDEQPAAARAVPPPRIGERDPTAADWLPLEVVFLDPARRLPVLVPTRRAA